MVASEPGGWGPPYGLEGLAAHRGGEPVAKPQGQRGQDQADVGASRDVIGDDKNRNVYIFEIFAALDFRMAKNLCGGRHKRVVTSESQGAQSFAVRPPWVSEFGPERAWLPTPVVHIADRFRL